MEESPVDRQERRSRNPFGYIGGALLLAALGYLLTKVDDTLPDPFGHSGSDGVSHNPPLGLCNDIQFVTDRCHRGSANFHIYPGLADRYMATEATKFEVEVSVGY